jgi:hypothetical protein
MKVYGKILLSGSLALLQPLLLSFGFYLHRISISIHFQFMHIYKFICESLWTACTWITFCYWFFQCIAFNWKVSLFTLKETTNKEVHILPFLFVVLYVMFLPFTFSLTDFAFNYFCSNIF